MKPRFPYVLACVIGLLLAAGFSYGGWVKLDEYRHIAAVGKATDGTITGYKVVRHTGRRGNYLSTTYHPTFRYRTEDGKDVEGTVPQPFEQDDIEVGRVMRVIYDPGNPTVVYIASVVEEGGDSTPWLLGGTALLVGGVSVFGLFRLSRRR